MILQNRYQDSFLGGQSIRGLVEHKRIVRIHDGIRHFETAVCGKAVHEIGVFARFCHQRVIDLVRLEDADTFLQLFLLTHAGPHVRVESIDAFHGFRFRVPFDFFAFLRAISFRTDGTERKTR